MVNEAGPEVHVWLIDVDDAEIAHRALALLPAGELERIAALAPPHRHRSANAHAALRVLAGGVDVVREAGGKPVAPGGPHVGMARCGPLAAIAVTAAGPVGIDLEELRAVPELDGFAHVALDAGEREEWLRDGGTSDALLRAWTRKEAVLKALGTGLAGGLRSVVTRLPTDHPRNATAHPHDRSVQVEALPPEAGPVAGWTVRDLPAPRGHAASVAVRAPGARVVRHHADLRGLLSGEPPRLTLFCLPHAGGNANHFRLWRRRLPDAVEVVPVDLPGHGTRLPEPLVDDWDALVADLADVVRRQVTGPYALLGHSLGALLAFDVARALQDGMPPEAFLVAGHDAPSSAPAHPPLHELSDPQLLGALHRLGGLPDALLRQPELLGLFLPPLRADLRLADRHFRRPGPGLSCPVVVFDGGQDRMTSPAGQAGWRAETTGSCEVVEVDGGHFFLQQEDFLTALTDVLARWSTPAQSLSVR